MMPLVVSEIYALVSSNFRSSDACSFCDIEDRSLGFSRNCSQAFVHCSLHKMYTSVHFLLHWECYVPEIYIYSYWPSKSFF